jgi:hypothetical protein
VIGLEQVEIVRFVTERGAEVSCAEPDDAVAGLAGFQYYVLPPPGPILAA